MTMLLHLSDTRDASNETKGFGGQPNQKAPPQ